MDHGGRGTITNAGWPTICSAVCATASHRGPCCISARANGIPGESLPRWALQLFLADATASRCGGTRPDRRRGPGLRAHGRATPADSSGGSAERLGVDSGCSHAGLRRRVALPGPGTAVAGQCRPAGSELKDPEQRARMAQVLRAGLVGRWPVTCCRCSVSGGRRERRWVSGPWPFRSQAMFLLARRFAHRPAFAARIAALAPARTRSPAGSSARSHARLASRCRAGRARRRSRNLVPPRHAARGRRNCGSVLPSRPRPERRQDGPRRASSGTALCVEPRDGRLHVFLPPVAAAGGLPGSRRRRRGDGGGPGHAGGDRRLSAAERPSAELIKVTPDPGVIEVNVHPVASLGGIGGRTPRPCTKRPACLGWAPRSSIWTGGTRAPAAATTWCSAAPRRWTALSCDGRTCSAAWSPTGTTIPPCRTCSPARSSAPPARPRESTKAAATRCTSCRSRSSRFPSRRGQAAPAPRGWSIASSAICWWT